MHRAFALMAGLFFSACSTSALPFRMNLVDLTHPMHPQMTFWPGGVPFKMERLVDYDQGYRLHRFEMGENTGTHVDAPVHFKAGAQSVAEIPLEALVVPMVVIDVQERVVNAPDFQLSASDIQAWEARYGEIPAGTFVVLNTGWHKKFGSAEAYANRDDQAIMHFPGYGIDAAELLLKRNVVGIGIDTLSIDPGISKRFETHQKILAAGKYMVENLANLDGLPATGATVVVGVLPVRDGTQAQARIFAMLP